MNEILKELYKKIYNNKKESILSKLNFEYALFYVSDHKEFSLIRGNGIFSDKQFIEDFERNYRLWDNVFTDQIYRFHFKSLPFIVMIDNPNEIKFLIFIRSNWITNQLDAQSLYLIFLMEIDYILHAYDELPIWYQDLLWNHIHKKSPLMILSEMGSLEDLFIDSFTRIKVGKTDNVVVFETLNLDEKVQMFELFGCDPGERLKTERIIPLIEIQSDIFIIKEITFLTKEVQKSLLNFFIENKEKIKQSYWIFTSNYDIEKMVKYQQFNKELWEFLKLNLVILPPLRKVGQQLLNEVHKYIDYLSKTYRKKIKLSQEAMDRILAYEWPGNLEELYLTLESAFILSRDDTIEEKDLAFGLWNIDEKKDLNLRKNIENLEKKFILKAYRLLGGNQVHMANTLGISRGSLQYKLQKYGIKIYD